MKKPVHPILLSSFLTIGAYTLGSLACPFALAEALKIQSFKTHGRMAFGIDESIPVEWKNTAKGFELLFRGATLSDLGVASGDEERWKAAFRSPADPRLGTLLFLETAVGVTVKGEWKYPSGKNAPAQPGMETFEYREKTPRYVVDFWWKKGPTAAEVEGARSRASKTAAEAKSRQEAKERAARKLASVKVRQETENAAHGFCSVPLQDSTDIFLSFLPFHEKVNFSRWFSARVPDENYAYFVPEAQSREAQYVRLALDLYKQGKPALTVRTLEFFEKEHPGSEFRFEMRLLKASALVKLGLSAESDEILGQLVLDAKESPVGLHAAMFLANSRYEKGQHLAALESFLWLANRYPKHSLNWVFHMGAAESLFALRQTERAAKEYQWVVENAPNDSDRIEAAARMGDLYLDRLQNEQALAAYYEALTHFPSQVRKFPSVFANRGETLYQLGEFDRAKEAFTDFLDKNPGHPAGWRAAFRLGEIYGRKAGDEARAESRRWFYETINRFPFSPGATLARMRLVTCGDQGGFDFAALERFFSEEAARFDGGGEVHMKRYSLVKGLAQVRAMITAGREDLAVTLALKELGHPSNVTAQPYLAKIVGYLFRKTIFDLLEKDKKYEALAFYQERKEMLLKDPSVEPDYLLALSRAASDLGLGSVGKELATLYGKSVEKSADRQIAAETGARDDFEADAKLSEQRFVRAKALWVSAHGAKLQESAKSELKSLLAGVTDESRYSFEKHLILSLVEEREGNYTAALSHAARGQVLAPESLAGDPDLALRLEAYIALLQVRGGDPRMALDLLRALGRKMDSSNSTVKGSGSDRAAAIGLAPAPARETILLAEADVLEKLGKWAEAAAAYAMALEKGMGGDRASFGYARAMMKADSGSAAEKGRAAMRKLASAPGESFWKKLAAETLANEQESGKDAKEGAK